jgi:predicted helicase
VRCDQTLYKTAFPRTTRKMGIVYTPIEIVDFILRSVDETLLRDFGQGIGAKGVHVIDPFTGTGTFIARLLQSGLIAPEDLERKYREELHANEVILLAYYIAAINIETAFQGLAQRNYLPFEGICLTDTFALHEHCDMLDAIMPDNSERRSRQRDLDIRVIVGNPPYVVGDDDGNSDAMELSYPRLDGRIRETYAARTAARNVNGLYNSYIRAIRWASDRLGADGGVIAFVTNAGFLDGNAAAGLRRCLVEEFSDLRIFDLKGNQRTSGERSRREGGKVFDAGSRAPIAMAVLTKRPGAPAAGAIHYHDIGDYLTREQKLRIIRDFRSIDGIEAADGWSRVEPDEHGDWLNQRDMSFDAFMAIGDRAKTEPVLFEMYSNGVKTQRDDWAFNASRAALELNISILIGSYTASVERIKDAGATDDVVKRLRVNDPRKISWSAGLITSLVQGRPLDFDPTAPVLSTYRPFTPMWLYYDGQLNERRYRIPAIFPDRNARTPTICLSAVGHKGQFSVLMVDRPPSLHTADMAGSQCFPLHWWEMVGEDEDPDEPELILVDDAGAGGRRLVRRDGITDAGLAHFRAVYPGEEITKEDLFFYVYGLLHAPDYRARYADNLKKALPRIPAVASFDDFRAFADAGRRLADLHMNYDAAEPFPATYEQGDLALANICDPADFFRVDRMRFAGKRPNLDRTRIVYNANLTLTGVPPEAYRYVVNGKSAIEHVMERQSVSVDRHNPQTGKGSDIVNDPNRFAIETLGDPTYPLMLLRRVITISLETVRIVNALPALKLKAAR